MSVSVGVTSPGDTKLWTLSSSFALQPAKTSCRSLQSSRVGCQVSAWEKPSALSISAGRDCKNKSSISSYMGKVMATMSEMLIRF